MRLLWIILGLATAPFLGAQPVVPTYTVNGPAGPWTGIFASMGLTVDTAPKVLVLRPDSGVPSDLGARIEAGLIVVIEANTAAAAALGVTVSGTVTVRRELDSRATDRMMVWEEAIPVLKAELPATATVFSQDRWSGTPLMAGWRRGTGGVLWLAAPVPSNGYARFTFLPQALAWFGLNGSLESKRTWAFFDYAYRSRTDPEYMARQWRKMGLSSIHAAAWYHFEPDAVRDDYLRRLITACHRNGILVYAWLEYPHVSDKFWADNPQWRDKTAQLTDAAVFWRKLMNFQNPDCVAAVKAGTKTLLSRFDWDGVNLAELYFESLLGPDDPAQFTPMNDNVRATYQKKFGYDPVDIFRPASPRFWKSADAPLQQLYGFRRDLNHEMHDEWLTFLAGLRTVDGNPLSLSMTNVDDQYDTKVRDYLGYDNARLVKLLDKIPFTFIIQDPATLWHLGAERYPKIASLYGRLIPDSESLAIDVNIARRQFVAYPTEQQAGTEVLSLARVTADSFAQTMYYSENSIARPDRALIPAASSSARLSQSGSSTSVETAYGVGLAWTGPANVNGKPWPYQSDTVLWLPAGKFTITPRESKPPLRLIDFNGTIRSVEEVAIGASATGVAFIYKSVSRSIAVLDQKPGAIWIDGKEAQPTQLPRRDGSVALILPAGEHWVTIAAPAK